MAGVALILLALILGGRVIGLLPHAALAAALIAVSVPKLIDLSGFQRLRQGCPSEPGRPIPYLDRLALEVPELRVIAGRIGAPWTGEMISSATKYPNVCIDTSAYKASRYPSELVDYLRGHGRHKVLFGSNQPAWPAPDCLAGLEVLGLDDATRRLAARQRDARVPTQLSVRKRSPIATFRS